MLKQKEYIPYSFEWLNSLLSTSIHNCVSMCHLGDISGFTGQGYGDKRGKYETICKAICKCMTKTEQK
jgi:hypothetical protein